MDKKQIEELAMLVEIYDYAEEKIKQAKEYFRTLTKEEVEKINKTTNLHIDRSAQHFKTYTEDYKARAKALQTECLVEDKKVEDYTIKLTTNKTITNKTDILTQFITQNKTTLKAMAKLAK